MPEAHEHEHGIAAGQLRHPGDGHGDRGGEPGRPGGASQRTDGFRGGVQAGTSATSAESSGHERNLRVVAKQLAAGELVWRSGYSAGELGEMLGVTGYALQGVQPDGGVWAGVDGRPVVAAEAKKQGVAGNAIERWYKNWDVLRVLGVQVYVTFCVGDGFFDGNAAQKTLETAVALHEQRSADEVWNTQCGTLWMYRYRSAEEAAAEMDAVLAAALAGVTK